MVDKGSPYMIPEGMRGKDNYEFPTIINKQAQATGKIVQTRRFSRLVQLVHFYYLNDFACI